MSQNAIRTIKDEHLAIAAVLYSLRYLVGQVRSGAEPNFPLLRAILDYIVSYPDRWHHPKEDKYLFAAVRRRTREADAVISQLEREHAQGAPMIAELTRKLMAYQAGDVAEGESFNELASRYAIFEWQHLRTEEEILLPIAERVLTPADWVEIDTAFRENDNPLFGIKPREEAETLYQRIMALTPAPIGSGSRPAS